MKIDERVFLWRCRDLPLVVIATVGTYDIFTKSGGVNASVILS